MLAITVTDQIGVGTLILAVIGLILTVPVSYVGWHTVRGFRSAAIAQKSAEEAERIGRIIDGRLQRVEEQVRPSNGHTVAQTVEEIHRKDKDKLDRLDTIQATLDHNKQDYTAAIDAVVARIDQLQGVLTSHLEHHARADT